MGKHKRGWVNANEGAGERERENESWGTRADERERLKGAGEREWMDESWRMRVGECEQRRGATATAATARPHSPPF
jgi:hypothetical protein